MKLNDEQTKLYDAFYESTHETGPLDQKTELLVGLSAAMSMNCEPCTAYYLEKCKQADIHRAELSAVLAKVMAVAAGQKRLQAAAVIEKFNIDLDSFDS